MMITFSARNEVAGQKQQQRTVKPPENKSQDTSPPVQKRTYSGQVKVITKKQYVNVIVNPKPNIGYLSVVANPTTVVTLTSLPEAGKKPAVIKRAIKVGEDSLNLINLSPGKYKILLEHSEYQPLNDTLQIDKATPYTYVALNKMVSRYGILQFVGIPQGAKVFWNEKALNLSNPSRGELNKVPVGRYNLKVVKEGFLDFEQEVDILPGKDTFVPVQLAVAIVTLNLTSEPGASVYVDGEFKGAILLDGKLAIQLIPGSHKIRVSKDGFKEWSRDLKLSHDNNPAALEVNLTRIPRSEEGNWDPDNRENKWYPKNSGWLFNKSGAVIRGDKLALFDTELESDFNYYQDVKLEFDVVFNNGRGVSWVARAKDLNNYYLFELTGPAKGETALNFYICQDGKLYQKDRRRVVEKMDVKDDTFHIIFEARGNRFETTMNIRSAPSAQPHRIGIFQDNTFSLGGVGFRGKDQSETLLQSLFIFPLEK